MYVICHTSDISMVYYIYILYVFIAGTICVSMHETIFRWCCYSGLSSSTSGILCRPTFRLAVQLVKFHFKYFFSNTFLFKYFVIQMFSFFWCLLHSFAQGWKVVCSYNVHKTLKTSQGNGYWVYSRPFSVFFVYLYNCCQHHSVSSPIYTPYTHKQL